MREIKFRLFDKVNKNMVYPSEKIYINMLGKIVLENTYDGEIIEANTDEYVLMQYTGLKDKNNIEIYEGDIYHQGDRNILYVVEYTQDCSFMGRQIRTKGSRVGLSYWQDRIEVIGNIHDSLDLWEAL